MANGMVAFTIRALCRQDMPRGTAERDKEKDDRSNKEVTEEREEPEGSPLRSPRKEGPKTPSRSPRRRASSLKGKGKGGSAGWSRCTYCWAKVGSFTSSLSQHQRWNLGCLQWQKYRQGYSWEAAGEAAVRTKQRRERKALRAQAKEAGDKECEGKKRRREERVKKPKHHKKERKRPTPTPSPSPARPRRNKKPLLSSSEDEEALPRVKSGKTLRALVIKLVR